MDSNNFGACFQLASVLMKQGEGERAAKYLKHAIKVEPNSVAAHFSLA